jgi:DNA-binding response OmpR family regulator
MGSSKINLNDLTILVVDDENSVTRLVRMMLSDIGVTQVFTAKNGKEALDLLGEFQEDIDIVICDWNMPTISGLDLLRQIRTVDPDLPFLMLTARADIASVKDARDYGVTDYLRKPFSAETMKKKITMHARSLAARRSIE